MFGHGLVPSGRVPITGDAPNVAIVDGGKSIIYDTTPEQPVWHRWAEGRASDEADWNSSPTPGEIRSPGPLNQLLTEVYHLRFFGRWGDLWGLGL